jgi:hypothetical protein
MSQGKTSPPAPPAPPPKHREALGTIKSLLDDGSAFRDGKPQFQTPEDIDRFATKKGFRLTQATAMGPQGMSDAQQLIWEGPNNVILKVKTRGYGNDGPPQRRGIATMSIEATDGKGTGWNNTLFKVDAQGRIRAKNIVSINGEVVPLPANHPARQQGEEWGVKNPRDGSVRPFAKFEVIQGGGGNVDPKPINVQNWADDTHLNMPEKFNPAGADKLAARLKGPTTPAGGGAPVVPRSVSPPKIVSVRGLFRGTVRGGAAAAFSLLLGWLKEKVDTNFINWQIEKLTPEIEGWLIARKVFIAELQRYGKKAYANVHLDIWWLVSVEDAIEHSTAPTVTFKSVEITDQDLNIAGKLKTSRENFSWEFRNPYTFSFEVSLPPEYLNRYITIINAIEAINAQLADPKLPYDQQRALSQQRRMWQDDLRRWMDSD